MIDYAISGAVGLGVGILYGLIKVNSPAPPLTALVGLLGMLAGQALIGLVRSHWMK